MAGTYRAVVCRTLHGPAALTLEETPSRPLKDGELRIRVRAAGLNFPDVLMTIGDYQLKPELPFTPGMEAAGDVVEIAGDGEGYNVGDRVIVRLRHGTFAEEVVATPAQLATLPKNFDYAEGATFLAAHGTAYHALVDRARLQKGETLLVHGAGGGVGLAAVEIGALLGADVIACASSDDKLAVAREKGAAHGLRSDSGSFRDAVKRLSGGRGADVVVDPVGGAVFEESLRCIAFGARLCVIGFTGGVGVAKTNLVLIKGASVLGIRAGEAVRRDPVLGIERFTTLHGWAEGGHVRPHISHRLPLTRIADAMRLLTDRKAIGRVAVEM